VRVFIPVETGRKGKRAAVFGSVFENASNAAGCQEAAKKGGSSLSVRSKRRRSHHNLSRIGGVRAFSFCCCCIAFVLLLSSPLLSLLLFHCKSETIQASFAVYILISLLFQRSLLQKSAEFRLSTCNALFSSL
jgi:hypothetical protein